MTRGLRSWANSPIVERQRRWLFALALVVVVAAAGVLLVTRPHHTARTVAPPRPGALLPAAPASPAHRARPAPVTHPGSRGVAGAVENAARRFLAGYLPYLYGHGPARAITDASGGLRARLAGRPLVVPPAQRRLDPKTLGVNASRTGGRWMVRATISDGGVADYPIVLTLERAGKSWHVSEVGQ